MHFYIFFRNCSHNSLFNQHLLLHGRSSISCFMDSSDEGYASVACVSVYCQRQLWILNSCTLLWHLPTPKERTALPPKACQIPHPVWAPLPAAVMLLLCEELQLRQVKEQGWDMQSAEYKLWAEGESSKAVHAGRGAKAAGDKTASQCLALGYIAGKQDQKLAWHRSHWLPIFKRQMNFLLWRAFSRMFTFHILWATAPEASLWWRFS